jgi:sec-independent protein translocase protein TatA
MNFFGIGLPEMILIGVVALLIFGPKKLPEIGLSVGKAIKGFQDASSDFQAEFKREAELLDQIKSLPNNIINSSALGFPMPPLNNDVNGNDVNGEVSDRAPLATDESELEGESQAIAQNMADTTENKLLESNSTEEILEIDAQNQEQLKEPEASTQVSTQV